MLNTQDKNFSEFLEWSKSFLSKNGKKITIKNSRNICFDGGKCSGWCDGNEMVVAKKNPLFKQVYCHEFSHMTQAIEDIPIWNKELIFWDKIQKQTIMPRDWADVMEVIELERDCEKRTINLSKKWQLFDNEQYAQQANLYLFYYQYVFLKKKWVDSTSIYHPLLIQEMPKVIKPLNTFNSINMELMALYDECLEKNGKFFKKGFTWNGMEP